MLTCAFWYRRLELHIYTFSPWIQQVYFERSSGTMINPIVIGGNRSAPQPLIPILLKILPYEHVLKFIDFSCMSITVLLQKNKAS